MVIFCICLYLIKNRMSDNTYGPIFNFFLVLEKLTMSETYGSTNLRLEFFDKLKKELRKILNFITFMIIGRLTMIQTKNFFGGTAKN